MYSYPYYYNSAAEIMGIMLSVFVIAFVLSFIIMLACYIFEAIGMYTISKKRGYNKPWLAFIPFANSYLFGAVTDNINAVNGKKSSFRVWLLVLKIINTVISFAYSVLVLVPMLMFLIDYIDYGYYGGLPEMLIAATVIFAFIISAVSITYTILIYIALHKIFSCYSRKNAVMFTVLNILFGIAPFILFAIRNNRPLTNAEYLNSLRAYYPQGGQYYPPNGYYQAAPGQPQPPQGQQSYQAQQWQAQQMQQQMQWQQQQMQNQQAQQASQPPQQMQAQTDIKNNNDQQNQ